MAKSSKKKSGKQRDASRRAKSALPQWVWMAGGVALVVILIFAGTQIFGRSPVSGEDFRPYESFKGITGTAYDAGATPHRYPNPGGLAGNRQWLPALGDENAPVVIMEFSDIYCNHCRDFSLDHLPAILEDYVATGKARYIVHYYGFPRTISEGVLEAGMCAAEQGRYFEFKHALFQTMDGQSYNMVRATQTANLDARAFRACRDSRRYADAVHEMTTVGSRRVTGTPTFFINGESISGNRPDGIRQMIDNALIQTE